MSYVLCIGANRAFSGSMGVDMSIYQENGYSSRRDYLENLADDMGIDPSIVYALADLLGPTEDFDGLVTSLEDYSEGY